VGLCSVGARRGPL